MWCLSTTTIGWWNAWANTVPDRPSTMRCWCRTGWSTQILHARRPHGGILPKAAAHPAVRTKDAEPLPARWGRSAQLGFPTAEAFENATPEQAKAGLAGPMIEGASVDPAWRLVIVAAMAWCGVIRHRNTAPGVPVQVRRARTRCRRRPRRAPRLLRRGPRCGSGTPSRRIWATAPSVAVRGHGFERERRVAARQAHWAQYTGRESRQDSQRAERPVIRTPPFARWRPWSLPGGSVTRGLPPR